MKRGNYTITPLDVKGVYLVENTESKDLYRVDTAIPSCSCDSFKFSKRDKKGNKSCKHIQICEGIIEVK